MSSKVPPVQDMPPAGGYSKINFARVPAKKLLTGLQMIAAVLTFHGLSACGFVFITKAMYRYDQVEMRSAAIATYPFFKAERDRSALLQMRKNRDVEEELMKDVEGWEVGKYENEPIYKTLKKDEWYEQLMQEYFIHSPPSDIDHHIHIQYRR